MSFLKSIFKKGPKVPKVDLKRRFELIGRVGQGSMSKVWRAKDSKSGKVVALKVLDPAKTKRFESRFIGLNKPSEGEIALTLNHPNIVKTYDIGTSTEDTQFLVMEFIEGVGLGYLVDAQNEIMQEHRLRLIVELGEAVEYFHRQNWIHRDICPRNILLDQDYSIKMIDFGLVVPNTEPFRRPGNRTGTPQYIAPELIKRQKTDQRIDVFSYSVTCYEMFAKRTPWTDSVVTMETILERINKPPIDIRELAPDIDEQLADIIMRGLEPNPNNRWRSSSQMLEEIRRVRNRIEGIVDEGSTDLDELFGDQPIGTPAVEIPAEPDNHFIPPTLDVSPKKKPKRRPVEEDDEDEFTDVSELVEVDDDDDDDEYESV